MENIQTGTIGFTHKIGRKRETLGKRVRYIYRMLVGNQMAICLIGSAVLLLSGLIVFAAFGASFAFSNSFINLQAGPVPHISLFFDTAQTGLKQELLPQIRQINEVVKVRSGYVIETACTLVDTDGNDYERKIQIRGIDLSGPGLWTHFSVNGQMVTGECKPYSTAYFKLKTSQKLDVDDVIAFKQIVFDHEEKQVDWHFRVKRVLGTDAYWLVMKYQTSSSRQQKKALRREMEKLSRDYSMAQFVPDLSSCIGNESKNYVYQVNHFHKYRPTQRYGDIDSNKTVEVGYVLVSQPLLNDTDWSFAQSKKFTIRLSDGTHLYLNGRGVFNAKLNRTENSRVIIIDADRLKELAGIKKSLENYIEIRLSDPLRTGDATKKIKALLRSNNYEAKVKTWQDQIFPASFKMTRIVNMMGTGFSLSVMLVSLFVLLNIFAVMYEKTMHHQMLLRLVGLGNIIPYYAGLGCVMALPAFAAVLAVQLIWDVSGWKDLGIVMCFIFFTPIGASIIFGLYYKRNSLDKFVEE